MWDRVPMSTEPNQPPLAGPHGLSWRGPKPLQALFDKRQSKDRYSMEYIPVLLKVLQKSLALGLYYPERSSSPSAIPTCPWSVVGVLWRGYLNGETLQKRGAPLLPQMRAALDKPSTTPASWHNWKSQISPSSGQNWFGSSRGNFLSD